MVFNSIGFILFFPLTCIFYFLIPQKYRWIFLLLASYFFYMNWKPVYAVLILFSTVTTWLCGILIEKEESKSIRKTVLIISLCINFGILFTFKYFNFINESIFYFLEYLGLRWSIPNLDLLLPVGISFYTFQAVSYTIEIYQGTIKTERSLGIYALFVSFFPQLVAGPIERAQNLLPQFREKHTLNISNISSGFKQMLWGYFMKVVIADRVAIYVNSVYNNVDSHNGTTFIIATVFFAIQIYCDFAGYSNIAIGAARIMGFNLMENFNRPYFAKSISDFWSRWHISLSTWFRDYLYIPLGGNRVPLMRHLLNLFITFIVSGIWHGANWTFVVWGALHGFYLVFEVLLKKYSEFSRGYSFIPRVSPYIVTLTFVIFAWIFFRANTISNSFHIVNQIFTNIDLPFIGEKTILLYALIGIMILAFKEIKDEYFPTKFLFFRNKNMVVRYLSYSFIIILILLIGVFDGGQFIYFQF